MLKKKELKKESDVTSREDVVKNDVSENTIFRMNRRRFLQMTGATAAALALGRGLSFDIMQSARAAFSQSPGLKKFAEAMRGVFPIDPNGIPVAIPDGTSGLGGALHYTIDINQYTDTLYSATTFGPTTLRGYHSVANLVKNPGDPQPPQRHLGGIIVANKGIPIQITFRNNLSGNHPIPIDQTIMGANLGQNRTATHLHGGFVPWVSDGGPHAWFDSAGGYGASIISGTTNLFTTFYKGVLNTNLQPGQLEYYYPNNQSARMEWYHDHAWGITRMNAYVGIASAYVIRDTFEADLVNGTNNSGANPGGAKGLPDYIEKGGNEIPIAIQDKIFVDAAKIALDTTWTGLKTTGSLWYAHTYDPKLYKLAGNKKGTGAPPDPSIVPEFFGDTMLANGKVYPEVSVEPRRYRLRVLNACQARFLNLQLYVDDGSTDSITLNPATLVPANTKGPDFLVLGTEGGFLPKPVLVPSNNPFNPLTLAGSLITGPAERWDLIVDFSGYAGQKIILYNDAPAPFPIGSPLNDYFPGAQMNPTITTPGYGPNSRQIMRFNVGTTVTLPADTPLTISPATDLTSGIDPPLVNQATGVPLVTVTRTRALTLNEGFDAFGRLIQFLGTAVALKNVGGGFGRAYTDPATETPKQGDVEIWEIYNLTGDTHPIHFHLVNAQIINRQAFKVNSFNGVPASFIGLPRLPEPTELGWKETVKMHPGDVTRVIMKFDLTTGLPFTVPLSPNPNLGVSGHEYVWHCHILEHEEHDMMRPLVVI